MRATDTYERLASECVEHSRLESQRLIAIRLGDISSACRIWAAMDANERRQDELRQQMPAKAMRAGA